MGHIPIVNQETLNRLIQDGCISIKGKLKDHIVKTVADLFADALATRPGDLVFPWIISSKNSPNLGFKYIFKVADRPYFVSGDEYPIKIPLEEAGEEYAIPLSEAEALDLWDKRLLWNIIGKKSLGRGRGLSHQTKMEDSKLIEMLERKNNESKPKTIRLNKYSGGGVPITIDPLQVGAASFQANLSKFVPEERLKNIRLKDIPWRKGDTFTEEKVLEAWLMENIDKPACSNLRAIIIPSGHHIDWFGNYLPYGVQGLNIDVVVSHLNGSQTISVIELKVGKLSSGGLIETAKQVEKYSLFIKRAFAAFNINVDTEAVIISHENPGRRDNDSWRHLPITSIVYNIQDDGIINFFKE
jgi:hypothetical protein